MNGNQLLDPVVAVDGGERPLGQVKGLRLQQLLVGGLVPEGEGDAVVRQRDGRQASADLLKVEGRVDDFLPGTKVSTLHEKIEEAKVDRNWSEVCG